MDSFSLFTTSSKVNKMSKEISVKVVKNFIDLMNEGAHLVNAYHLSHGIPLGHIQNTLAIVCDDGFTLSIQASAYHYCQPRQNFFEIEKESGSNQFEAVIDYSIYTHFEIGFPSEAEPLLIEYADDISDLTETVYGYVPKELIEKVIAKHGGAVAFCSHSLK